MPVFCANYKISSEISVVRCYISETEFKIKESGTFDECIDLNSSWSKAFQLASNYLFTEPVDTAPRWPKKEKKYIGASRPHIFKVFLICSTYYTAQNIRAENGSLEFSTGFYRLQ